MSFLPASSLAALMVTCRYFSEVALPQLCKLAWIPLYWEEDLLSFRRFLRIGSPAPRWPHIRKLDFRLEWLASTKLLIQRNIEPTKQHRVRELGESLMDVLLHVLRACRNLEYLRIPELHLCHQRDIDVMCLIISKLPVLTELRMALPSDVTVRMLRKLAKPHLHTLTFNHWRSDDAEIPEVIQHLYSSSLRQSLVELCLPRFHGCVLPPDVIFPRVQRLTFGFPGPMPQSLPDVLRQSFPNLLHLRMTGVATWFPCSTSCLGRQNLEGLRERHEREWPSKPNAWPTLASLSCHRYTSEAGLYGLAIPCHIPYLSIRVDDEGDIWERSNTGVCASRSATLVTDVRPSCLELRMTISEWSFKTAASGDDAGCMEFQILRTPVYSSPLRRFVLTIERDAVATKTKGVELETATVSSF